MMKKDKFCLWQVLLPLLPLAGAPASFASADSPGFLPEIGRGNC